MNGADYLGPRRLRQVAKLPERIVQRPELVATLEVDRDEDGAFGLGSYVNQPGPGRLFPVAVFAVAL